MHEPKQPVKILVAGDRNWRCEALAARIVQRLIARYGRGITIVHGACSGVDSAFAGAAVMAGGGDSGVAGEG
jgi:hypothetical protein